MAADMPWRRAVETVLSDADAPMRYDEIAQAIIDAGYRVSVGATPAATVSAILSESIRKERKTPFVKVDRGVYSLRSAVAATPPAVVAESDEAVEDAREMGLINAFGMYWNRASVRWKTNMPSLYGVQQFGSTPVNFTAQAGVYLLYDGRTVVYVGKVTEPRMGLRLFEHTRDRLSGRWDRFSWFGVRAVRDSGELSPLPPAEIAVATLIATMEALLIEGLEPPQNRRQGDGFNAVEFLQVTDPQIERDNKKDLLAEMSRTVGLS